MFNNPYYFSIIRKYVILFGTLFNDIRITRSDSSGNLKDVIRVPITYAPKDKMIVRVTQDPNIDRQAAIQLPFISFEISGIEYDGGRKLPSVNRVVATNASISNNNLNYQYVPVPYNIGFTLTVYVKNAEDGTKIIEQILPYFTPDWTVTANMIPEMNVKMDIPVILDRVSINDSYDGDFKVRRALTWTLDFTLKGYVYGPVKNSKIIKFANVEFFDSGKYDNIKDSVGVTDPVAYIQVQPGLTSNGQPTSNSSLSVPVADIIASDDFGFVTTITEMYHE
mgnify:CR=1 FL=1